MRYLPHTDDDVAEMLQTIGAGSLSDMFAMVPESARLQSELKLPPMLTEWELNRYMDQQAAGTATPPEYDIYLGAGRYEHYVPASVNYLLGRSEFSTAYTPYQPEISQGTLQAIFEYQTLVSRLLGMEVANASLYDGASALAEAVLMAVRATRKETVAISRLVNPFYRRVVDAYLRPTGITVIDLPYTKEGATDLSAMKEAAAIVVQSPNFFGCVEDLEAVAAAAKKHKALFVSTFTEPLAFGLLKSPGVHGADIACGEGQSFGIPISYGGPGLGMFATRMKYVRSMPGRLIGKTTDADGKTGFVLTLATREQHIRREKATSNICTNSGLCATTSAMYMASLGGTGIRHLAALNRDKTEYLKRKLTGGGINSPFSRPTFNEFVAVLSKPDTYETLLSKNIVAGFPLAAEYPELEHHYLLCVTETKSKADLDRLAAEVTS